jgi:hypothetical protein
MKPFYVRLHANVLLAESMNLHISENQSEEGQYGVFLHPEKDLLHHRPNAASLVYQGTFQQCQLVIDFILGQMSKLNQLPEAPYSIVDVAKFINELNPDYDAKKLVTHGYGKTE